MDYIKDRNKLLELLKSRLTEEKYIHSISTEERAVELAEKYGVDPVKAGFAGLLHDITKCEEDEETLAEYYGVRYLSKKTIHQWTGAAYIREKGITDDDEILDAVRTHTTGCADMTDLQKIIYLADATEKYRDYGCVDKLRELSDRNLDEAMVFSLEQTIRRLQEKNLPIDANTINAYNYLKNIN